MKNKKLILFVFTFVFSLLTLSADEYYGNIRLRSIGVGYAPQTKTTERITLHNHTSSEYTRTYGRSDNAQNYTIPSASNYSTLKVDRMSKENKPFENDVVATGNMMYAFPTNPKDPGAPIGDAIPFSIILAGIYIYLRSKK